MRRIITHSRWIQALALVVAMATFVLLYETRALDSSYAVFHSILSDNPQPPPGSRLTFSATAYCKGSTTASGVTVRTGVAAADPQLLPVGSVINVATGDPKYNGVYTIMDTGPEVQGRELDLYMWSCNEALVFGRRPIHLTVLRLGWNPRATTPSFFDRFFKRPEPAPLTPLPSRPLPQVPRGTEN
jgi:3D (Asp-Asp-Asp) domain-containing protein